MDPAQQSLSDALRVSFRALKLVMLVLLVLFLVNGFVFNVDEKEVVVLFRFGKPVGEPYRSGLKFSLPYPIDERVKVPMYQRSLTIDDFWLRISDRNKTKNLNELPAKSGGLNPEQEGALLTGDRALMHLKFTAQYRVRDDAASLKNYVLHIPINEETGERDAEMLLVPLLRSAAVAEAARITADAIYSEPTRVVAGIRRRAQAELNQLETGIELTNMTADQRYFPLQVKREFLSVDAAASRKRQLIQDAEKERVQTLQGAAGAAWEALKEQLDLLGQVEEEAERERIIAAISRILEEEATGEAGRLIQEAKRDREKLVENMLTRVRRFEILLPQYRENPELVKKQLQIDMLAKLWAQEGVTRFVLPEGENINVLWIDRDPLEVREAERRRMEQIADR